MVRDDAQAAEANRLYWNQAASVGEIANQLGISRRALYEVLEPRPAGVQCPKCGAEGVFVNRSAQAAGLARCPNDATEMEAAKPESAAEPAATAAAAPHVNGAGRFNLRIGIGSAALMGVVVGAIATLLLTQRE